MSTNQPLLAKNDDLRTPHWVYSPLGQIDLDPCAGIETDIAQVNWAIERGQCGLTQNWKGFVYCNPPFSQKEIWSEKMIQHGNGLLLLPERGSAPWFTHIVKHCKDHWVMGKKINFEGGSSSNNVGSVIFAFGQEAIDRLIYSGLPGHLNHIGLVRERVTKLTTTRNRPTLYLRQPNLAHGFDDSESQAKNGRF